MTSLTPEVQYPMKLFQVSKFDVSSISLTGDIQIFKLIILLTLSSSKLICILLTLGKLKFTLFGPFYSLLVGHSYFTSLSKTCHEKRFKPPPLDKNSGTTHVRSVKVIFNDPVSRNQELLSLVNRQASKTQSFISFCNTFF